MKKIHFKAITLLLSVTILSGLVVGCSGKGSEKATKEFEQDSVTISGSSALLPLMEKTNDKFKELYPDVSISAQAGGSGTGLQQVSDKSVNIGTSDVFAEDKLDKDKAAKLVDHKVVVQGFGIAVSKDLGVSDLTTDQIKGIFSGKIKNWSEVGGPNKEILVIHRPSSSGTRGSFTKAIFDGDKTLEADSVGITQDNNGSVLTSMKQNDGSISYVALSYMISDEAKAVLSVVSIDGVEPTKDNIINNKYKFWSWGHMYTNGEPKDLEKAFIDYVQSPENADSLESLGLISGAEMKTQ